MCLGSFETHDDHPLHVPPKRTMMTFDEKVEARAFDAEVEVRLDFEVVCGGATPLHQPTLHESAASHFR